MGMMYGTYIIISLIIMSVYYAGVFYGMYGSMVPYNTVPVFQYCRCIYVRRCRVSKYVYVHSFL